MSGQGAPVMLSLREQEYLLLALEAALPVTDTRQFFLWTQGPLQALLPHQVMVALHFDAGERLLHVECQHSTVLDVELRHCLAAEDGVAVALARHCLRHDTRSLLLDADSGVSSTAAAATAPFLTPLRALGVDNLVLHSTGRLAAGASVFVLLGLPQRPHARHARFLALLLPQLHMMMQQLTQRELAQCQLTQCELGQGQPGQRGAGRREPAQGAMDPHDGARGAALARPVSARETEILHWVREGKSNVEIGLILGISGLTVKNHLQRLYRLLGVSNRTHAIARGAALRLFDRAAVPLARAA
ncbi:LuxR family transcriptional regulator [Duganella sp. Leaf126]|uniref:LuxR C-terminal-related transcriptional regulator n=1 Tax=Duganella sp. Leaf126 TaxID=1736266 RepID=UPI0006FCB8F1|nr:LuxR C-terminal-related transcriptional regulator [Duganella sp. Leaf126]KQQ46329.1 LuxR family transcriptional regulator [Duganella sp. Leaf126]